VAALSRLTWAWAGNLGGGLIQLLFVVAVSLNGGPLQPRLPGSWPVLLVSSFFGAAFKAGARFCGSCPQQTGWWACLISFLLRALLSGIGLMPCWGEAGVANALLARVWLKRHSPTSATLSRCFRSPCPARCPWKALGCWGSTIVIQHLRELT